jgi:tripartite-type tricarboxylate transporter receptor subunit TctC
MISRRHCLKLLATSMVAAPHVHPSPLHAGQWPHRTVRLIVPVGAGSATDVAARLFADGLARRWKQPVIVENRPGADGLIGTAAFVGARDEHTLLFSFASPVSVLPAIHASLSYDPGRDLVPISLATDTFAALTVPTSLNINSLRDLVALARSQPGRLNYFASSGAFPYLLAGFLKSQHLDLVAVSYREQSMGMRDHAQGGTQLAIAVITSSLPFVQSGHLRFLAVTNSRRSPLIPDVPTAAESGFAELAFEGMAGLFGPAGLSAELRDRIAEDVRAVADDAAVASRLAATGQVARATTASEFSAMLAAQRAQIATIVQETGLLSSH